MSTFLDFPGQYGYFLVIAVVGRDHQFRVRYRGQHDMAIESRARPTLQVVLLILWLSSISAANSRVDEDSRYLKAVREFADNVLKYGRDTYGPKHTPLFVDGLNIHTHEPVEWIAPNGDRWIFSNLASPQNLFRTLDGRTEIVELLKKHGAKE
jgi:hypothetical protein